MIDYKVKKQKSDLLSGTGLVYFEMPVSKLPAIIIDSFNSYDSVLLGFGVSILKRKLDDFNQFRCNELSNILNYNSLFTLKPESNLIPLGGFLETDALNYFSDVFKINEGGDFSNQLVKSSLLALEYLVNYDFETSLKQKNIVPNSVTSPETLFEYITTNYKLFDGNSDLNNDLNKLNSLIVNGKPLDSTQLDKLTSILEFKKVSSNRAHESDFNLINYADLAFKTLKIICALAYDNYALAHEHQKSILLNVNP